MFSEDVKKASAHALRGHNILTGSNLPNLRADDLGDAGPTGHTNHDGKRNHIGIAQNCLKEQHQQQAGNTEENLRKPHQQRIQPARRDSADGAVDHRDRSGNHRGKETNGYRDPAAVPDAGEYIPAHGIRTEQELSIGGLVIVRQIHEGGVLRHEDFREQAAQYNYSKQHNRDPRKMVSPSDLLPGGGFFFPNADHLK